MLRQGRGAGFLAALAGGDRAAEDVIGCVLDDPRWDPQAEARAGYYAELCMALDLDIAPIRERLVQDREDESEFWLPAGVLAEMAAGGHAAARAALAEGVRQGVRPRLYVGALGGAGGEMLIRSVVQPEDVAELLRTAERESVARLFADFPALWDEWVAVVPGLREVAELSRNTYPRIYGVASEWDPSGARLGPSLADDLSTSELLERVEERGRAGQIGPILALRDDPDTCARLRVAATRGSRMQRRVALRILGDRGCGDFIDDAEHYLRNEPSGPPEDWRPGKHRQACLDYLAALPGHLVLDRARRWFHEPRPLSLAAERVLERHATPEDRIMLEHAGLAALEIGDMYRLSAVASALRTGGTDASVPFLAHVYAEVAYSYARKRVVEALLTQTHVPSAYALLDEALWDCEPESRAFARGVHARGSAVGSTRASS